MNRLKSCMQLDSVAHASWNHKMQIFRKQKNKTIEFSISHRQVFSVIFECVLVLILKTKWLLDYFITENLILS